MPSHYSSVGMPVSSMDELGQLAEAAAQTAQEIPAQAGRYVCWDSPEGAQLWIHVDEHNDLVGAMPFFRGNATLQVSLIRWIERPDEGPLDGALYGWMQPETGNLNGGMYPFVFDLPDAGCHRNLTLPCLTNIQLSAFAHELQVYDSEESFRASPDSMSFATEAFIPSGLLTPEGQENAQAESQAIFSGKVASAQRCINPLTQQPYYVMRINTLGGEFSVVADISMLNELPQPGNIVLGSFWLCGRIIVE